MPRALVATDVSATMRPNAEQAEARPRVAVVINTYNQAHYLNDAIQSVLNQSRPAEEILVVDDGSSDEPEHVLETYPGIRFIRQQNQGLAASRNTGLKAATAEMIAFLDADDRLLPTALASGLACHQRVPGCAFVYGSYRNIANDGKVLGSGQYIEASEHPYLDLLGGNIIGMHATVMYRRDVLVRHGGFDAKLRRCEDYDVYLKLARHEKIASHADVIAEYRRHDANMSHDHRGMLATALLVLERQEPHIRSASGEREAVIQGRRLWRQYFARQAFVLSLAVRKTDPLRLPKAVVAALKVAPTEGVFSMLSIAREYARKRLPPSVVQFLKRLTGRSLPIGHFNFGDFARTRPVSDDFGFDRGKPIDRYFIEAFLTRQSADIKGRTLEIGDDSYTRQFGGSLVQQADVLHVNADNPHATIVGDIAVPETLPQASFDCLVLTQTLHFVYDMQAAVAEMHRALKPGGVALLTVPGISQIDNGAWRDTWYWSITPAAAKRLFAEVFGPENVEVQSHGNVYAATAFLQGLAVEEVDQDKLDIVDPAYPVIVTVRARKQG